MGAPFPSVAAPLFSAWDNFRVAFSASAGQELVLALARENQG
jgi:hypothetical protein